MSGEKCDSFFLIEPQCPAGPRINTPSASRMGWCLCVRVFECVCCGWCNGCDSAQRIQHSRTDPSEFRALVHHYPLSLLPLFSVLSRFFFTTIFAFRHAPLKSLLLRNVFFQKRKTEFTVLRQCLVREFVFAQFLSRVFMFFFVSSFSSWLLGMFFFLATVSAAAAAVGKQKLTKL